MAARDPELGRRLDRRIGVPRAGLARAAEEPELARCALGLEDEVRVGRRRELRGQSDAAALADVELEAEEVVDGLAELGRLGGKGLRGQMGQR